MYAAFSGRRGHTCYVDSIGVLGSCRLSLMPSKILRSYPGYEIFRGGEGDASDLSHWLHPRPPAPEAWGLKGQDQVPIKYRIADEYLDISRL